MDLFAPRHLLIILVIVLLVFGTKKLKTIGSDLGAAVRGFKQSMKEGDSNEAGQSAPASPGLLDAADLQPGHQNQVNQTQDHQNKS